MDLVDQEIVQLEFSKFNKNDWVRIRFAGIENENLMLYGAYQINSLKFINDTGIWDYGIKIKNIECYYIESQLRHAYKYEILEAKICG